MPRIIQSYLLKLPPDPRLRQQVEWLHTLGFQAAQHLLKRLWSEGWMETLAASKRKAYKVIGEAHVRLTLQEQQIYLPSRIRRCITEQVGRILRSQIKRKTCYYDVLQIVQITGVTGNLDTLVRRVGVTLSKFYDKYYRWAMIRQILRTFRRYYYQLGFDLAGLAQIPYTQLVKPTITAFVLPYAPDDGLAIKISWDQTSIIFQMKLPRTQFPRTLHDWAWIKFTLMIPPKILQRIQSEQTKLHLPTLRYLTLKGGLQLPCLDVAWTLEKPSDYRLKANRVLATDLGVINLTTSVICAAGSQISPPLFWSPQKALLHRIEQLYHHVTHLQRKLDHYPKGWRSQGKRLEERARLYRKLNRYRKELLHQASNQLLEAAVAWECQTIVLEDLRSYEPPKHKRTLSRKLSNWVRGAFYEVLTYKAKRCGIMVRRVNPRWTSTICPRCGGWGAENTGTPREE